VAASIPGSSSDVEILARTTPPSTLSIDSSTAWLSEDDPNWHFFHNVPVQELEAEEIEKDNSPVLPPPPKHTKEEL
jgi:hypothetical protein